MFSEDTAALMEKLDIPSAHFMGLSMGSAIIQQMCIDHPDKVQKVILCAPFTYLPEIAKNNIKTQLKLLAKGVGKRDLMQLNASWLLSNAFLQIPSNLEKFLDDFFTDPYPQTMEGLLSQSDALFECDLRSSIKKIPHETLLLVGERDIDTPPYCAKYIAEEIQNCKVHIFKEMGHMFCYEIPEKVTKKALEFLLSS